jgi:hypothetical protein
MLHDATEEGLVHLQNIEEELGEIKERTASGRRSFVNGILQGAGVVIGTLLAISVLSWILSLLGIVPGLGQIAAYLHDLVTQTHSR